MASLSTVHQMASASSAGAPAACGGRITQDGDSFRDRGIGGQGDRVVAEIRQLRHSTTRHHRLYCHRCKRAKAAFIF